jgi:uncharacterized membrane protein
MTPDWVLTLFYWVHMLATVLWIGGLSVLLILILPLANRTLSADSKALFYEQIQRRFDLISWFSLILLIVTGMFQMSASPNYEGFFSISNRWAMAILVKHILFGGMILVNTILSLGVLPGLKRVALKQRKGVNAPEAAHLQRREILLLRINFLLGLLILGMTALARIS